MKIFIGWSGERSKQIAGILREWLKLTLQHLDPWMSEQDIASGSRWSAELEGALQSAEAGIICVTPENKEEPWIFFEAGAISKTVIDKTLVCPFLFDLSPADLKGPLTQFQAVSFHDKTKVKKMLQDFNSVSKRADTELLGKSFDMWWPKLEDDLKAVLRIPQKERHSRKPDEIIEEILLIVRDLSLRFSPLYMKKELARRLFPNANLEGLGIEDNIGLLGANIFEKRQYSLQDLASLRDLVRKIVSDAERLPKEQYTDQTPGTMYDPERDK